MHARGARHFRREIAMLVEVGTTGDLNPGAMKEVRIDGRELLLARVGDDYLVADNRCPHLNGVLSQGRLDGSVVTCPRHGSRFDLTDGRVVRWTGEGLIGRPGVISTLSKLLKPPRPLRVYIVKTEDGKILAEL